MMGKRVRCCFKQSFLSRRQATVSLTALASFTSSWPVISLHDGFNRRGRLSLPKREQGFIRQSLFAQERTMSIKAGSEFPHSSQDEWKHLLPFEDWSHNSAKIVVPKRTEIEKGEDEKPFDKATFADRLNSTVATIRELEKSSVWVEVPISRSSSVL